MPCLPRSGQNQSNWTVDLATRAAIRPCKISQSVGRVLLATATKSSICLRPRCQNRPCLRSTKSASQTIRCYLVRTKRDLSPKGVIESCKSSDNGRRFLYCGGPRLAYETKCHRRIAAPPTAEGLPLQLVTYKAWEAYSCDRFAITIGTVTVVRMNLTMAMEKWAILGAQQVHYCEDKLEQWTHLKALHLLCLVVACYATLWLSTAVYKRIKRSPQVRTRSPDLEKRTSGSSKFRATDRVPGTWVPVDFKRPTVPPYPDWDVHGTKPLPYRPFKYGAYHITMGLRTMKWEEWIELDNQFPKFHADKVRRIRERGARGSRTAPEALDGACELLEEL